MKPMMLGTAAVTFFGATAFVAMAAGHLDPTALTCAEFVVMDEAGKTEAFDVVKAAVEEAGGAANADMPTLDATCAATPDALVAEAIQVGG